MALPQWNHFIGGGWSEPSSGTRVLEHDPRTGRSHCAIARGNNADVAQAVAAARGALAAWRSQRPAERGRILHAVAQAICAHADHLNNIERAETGKPASSVREIEIAAQYFEFYAGLVPFEDEADAVAIANDSEFGLAAGIWTKDLSRAHRVASALETAHIYINEYFAGGVETPLGGYKNSGFGREKGIEALHHFTQLKAVTIKIQSQMRA